MQPRGQLWFQLEQICQDFKDYSGLSAKEALKILVAVLENMLAKQRAELERVNAQHSAEEG
jgi:hypothetical protein